MLVQRINIIKSQLHVKIRYSLMICNKKKCHNTYKYMTVGHYIFSSYAVVNPLNSFEKLNNSLISAIATRPIGRRLVGTERSMKFKIKDIDDLIEI